MRWLVGLAKMARQSANCREKNFVTNENVDSYQSDSSISSSMLLRIKAGDQDAWDLLVDLYGRLVYWWCRRKGVDEQGASDIGQEVFLAAYKYKDNFERVQAGDSFRGWLRKITNSKIADYYRKRNDRPIAVGDSTAAQWPQLVTDPEDVADEISEETRILCAAILDLIRSEFSDIDWNAFSRVVIDGQTPADTAIELGITRNQVYLAKSRILRRVRDQFGDEFESEITS